MNIAWNLIFYLSVHVRFKWWRLKSADVLCRMNLLLLMKLWYVVWCTPNFKTNLTFYIKLAFCVRLLRCSGAGLSASGPSHSKSKRIAKRLGRFAYEIINVVERFRRFAPEVILLLSVSGASRPKSLEMISVSGASPPRHKVYSASRSNSHELLLFDKYLKHL